MTTRRTTPAQLIKAELKKAFPGIKFSCKYRTFAGGDDVHVSWKGGPLTTDVDRIASQYQAGYFDGMEDIYEFTNDKPYWMTAKYVFCEREEDDEETKEWIEELGNDCINAAVDFGKREGKWACDIRDHIKSCITASLDRRNNIGENYSSKRSNDNSEKGWAIANYLMKVNNLR